MSRSAGPAGHALLFTSKSNLLLTRKCGVDGVCDTVFRNYKRRHKLFQISRPDIEGQQIFRSLKSKQIHVTCGMRHNSLIRNILAVPHTRVAVHTRDRCMPRNTQVIFCHDIAIMLSYEAYTKKKVNSNIEIYTKKKIISAIFGKFVWGFRTSNIGGSNLFLSVVPKYAACRSNRVSISCPCATSVCVCTRVYVRVCVCLCGYA